MCMTSVECPGCGCPVPPVCMKWSSSEGDAVTEVYVCPGCGVRFYVETGILTEDD